ncbi:hypothetical protein CA54_33620 [Symmachiella macrocystis]|uniref:Uncharacterized protein n=1 Tax=Symmachiella macrocystis TaxID=2527985 RepID=A0A5C6BR53_9PLAN|nr:hypothetical protein [Symmachiella macrocystis]TWU14495.1 hypothetical protein CA54_33620 [Symmachiella macrocystis]
MEHLALLSSAVNFNAVAVTVLIIVVLAILVTIVLRRRRENVWQAFARRNGFQYQVVEGQPQVKGLLEGRRFELAISPESSDTGPLGVEVISMAVFLHHPPPGDLLIESAGGLVGDVQLALNEHRFQSGDAEFDQNVNVENSGSAAGVDWLTPKKRQAFLQLVQATPSDSYLLAAGQLRWQCRTAISVPDKLDEHLRSLAAAVRELDNATQE